LSGFLWLRNFAPQQNNEITGNTPRATIFGRKAEIAAFLAISAIFSPISAGFAPKSISCKMSNIKA
jgi:hypothetical protein